MSTKVPFLSRLGIYRISSEKQETLLKLMVLSTAAILCEGLSLSGGRTFRSLHFGASFLSRFAA